jgi:hypothetical protein
LHNKEERKLKATESRKIARKKKEKGKYSKNLKTRKKKFYMKNKKGETEKFLEKRKRKKNVKTIKGKRFFLILRSWVRKMYSKNLV